jgi:hypothetical protein
VFVWHGQWIVQPILKNPLEIRSVSLQTNH